MGTKGTWQRPVTIDEAEREARWRKAFAAWICGYCGEPNGEAERRECEFCGVPRDWEPNE
jgi:hypothetical protein